MSRGVSKRTYHRQDMEKMNTIARRFGLIAGILILAAIIVSFLLNGSFFNM